MSDLSSALRALASPLPELLDDPALERGEVLDSVWVMPSLTGTELRRRLEARRREEQLGAAPVVEELLEAPPPALEPEPVIERPDLAPALTREQARSRRKRERRAHTINVKRMTKREIEIGRMLYPEQPGIDYQRPRTRGECIDGARPCPFVSCAHHIALDVSARTGAIKLNFPDLEVWEMAESCALDIADRGGATLEDVGALMNLTRERVRQVEVKALAKLDRSRALERHRDEGRVVVRRLPVLVDEDLEETEAE